MGTKTTWTDLSSGQQAGVLTLISIQLSLVATAWTDLAVRPAEEVNGPKALWAAMIAVSSFGPALYFTMGRHT